METIHFLSTFSFLFTPFFFISRQSHFFSLLKVKSLTFWRGIHFKNKFWWALFSFLYLFCLILSIRNVSPILEVRVYENEFGNLFSLWLIKVETCMYDSFWHTLKWIVETLKIFGKFPPRPKMMESKGTNFA